MRQVPENGEVRLSIKLDPTWPREPVSASKLLFWKRAYFFFEACPSPVCKSYQILRLFVVDIGKSFRRSAVYYNVTAYTQDSGLAASATLVSKSIRFRCSPAVTDGISLVVPRFLFGVQKNSTLSVKLKIGIEKHTS